MQTAFLLSGRRWPCVLRAGKLNGFGFVQFEGEEGAARACQLLHGADFMGRELTVDAATAAKSGSQQAPNGQPVEGCWFCLSNPKADVNLVASIGEGHQHRLAAIKGHRGSAAQHTQACGLSDRGGSGL